MAAFTVTLSDEQLSAAQAAANRRGISDVEAYLHLLLAEHLHDDETQDEDFGAPAHLRVSTLEQVRALIQDGLNSPTQEMTAADFDLMRRELIERHAKSRAE